MDWKKLAPPWKLTLFRRFFFVNLVVLQYGIDSTLWLPTVYAFINTLVDHSRVTYYLSLTQLLPTVVHFFVSILVGPLVSYFGTSLKWPMFVFLLCSAAGNFLYSCAGIHGIDNVWAIIGGRMLSGLASGSSSLSMVYIVKSSSTEERLPALSWFRTFAGVALGLGPLLSIPLTRFSFHIGKYTVNETNAPTFVASGIAIVVAITICAAVKNKMSNKVNVFSIFLKHHDQLMEHGMTSLLAPVIMMFLLFVSSFLMANVLFLISSLLRSPDHWDLGLTLISGLQTVIFFMSLLASLCTSKLHASFMSWTNHFVPRACLYFTHANYDSKKKKN